MQVQKRFDDETEGHRYLQFYHVQYKLHFPANSTKKKEKETKTLCGSTVFRTQTTFSSDLFLIKLC